jgi:hypothetical protein
MQLSATKINHKISSQENLINDTFLYLNKVWASKGKALTQNITEKYFDSDTTLIINGKKVYTGYSEFNAHFHEVGKHILGNIRFPLIEVISVGNKVIVRFDEDIHDNNGIYYPTNVIAIFTLNNGKIKKWEEVVNTKYFCKPESRDAIYSK